jgi:hypothetical protein
LGLNGLSAFTREAKLGCVFTQTTLGLRRPYDSRPQLDQPIRAIENAEKFGKRLYVEAWQRGWSRAEKIHNEADYVATNAARMNYPKFRKQHLFVDSGLIEAG